MRIVRESLRQQNKPHRVRPHWNGVCDAAAMNCDAFSFCFNIFKWASRTATKGKGGQRDLHDLDVHRNLGGSDAGEENSW